MLDPLAALRAQPHYRRAIGRMRPIAPHPLPRRMGRCRPAPCGGKFLRGRSGTQPYLQHTTGLQTYAGGNPGHRVQAPGSPEKRRSQIFSGTFVLGCKPCFRNSANRGLGRPMPAKAGRRLGATPIMRLRAAIALFGSKGRGHRRGRRRMNVKEADFADGGHRRHGLCQPPGTFEGLRPTGSCDPRARLEKKPPAAGSL